MALGLFPVRTTTNSAFMNIVVYVVWQTYISIPVGHTSIEWDCSTIEYVYIWSALVDTAEFPK